MEVYLRPELAEEVVAIAAKYNVPAQVIGHCETLPRGQEVLIKTPQGHFTYTL